MLQHKAEIERFLARLTAEVPQVVQCITSYYHPALPQKSRFTESRGRIEGVYSPGNYTVKFRVETTAETDGQRAAMIAVLNEWLRNSR